MAAGVWSALRKDGTGLAALSYRTWRDKGESDARKAVDAGACAWCGGLGVARANENNCDDGPVAPSKFHQQAGDTVQAKHLALVRPFDGTGRLVVNICNADVRVLPRPQGKQLELTVNADDGSHALSDSVQTVDVANGGGEIRLKFPKAAHAKVTITLALQPASTFEFNLGHGDLDFNAAGSAGTREINVGMGSMKLVLSEKTYGSMEINIGLGSLHDHRPGEKDGHFVVSRNYTGDGDGKLEINVGMGSVDIRKD